MIYSPTKYPKFIFGLITLIVLIGIFAGYFVHNYYMAGALLFWIHYTLVLTVMQVNRLRKKPKKEFGMKFLNPYTRFFTFQSLAIFSFLVLIYYDYNLIGIVALILWWIFALNFYKYYDNINKKRSLAGKK